MVPRRDRLRRADGLGHATAGRGTSSTWLTRSLTCGPRGMSASPPRGDSFRWAPWLSATTSPVSQPACTGRSAGTWWMPWVYAALRSGLNAASTVGVGPVNGWSVAFYGGFGGYGVAHYLPLDGTVFHDSRSVDSEPFIGTGTDRHRRATSRLRPEPRPDLFHRHVRNRAEERGVRDVERVLVLLTCKPALPRMCWRTWWQRCSRASSYPRPTEE